MGTDHADTRSDAELLAAHVEGDPAAFTTVIARHRDRLWAVSLRTMGNPDDAADALQDALLAAHRGAAGFRGDAGTPSARWPGTAGVRRSASGSS